MSLRRNHLLVLAALAALISALVAKNAGIAVGLTLCGVCVANFVELWPYLKNPIIRRVFKHLPYFAPLPSVGVYDSTSLTPLLLATIPALVFHALSWRKLRLSFDRRIAALMEPQSMASKIGECAFFGLSGISQEYLHRHAVIAVLVGAIGRPAAEFHFLATFGICVASGGIFVLEHIIARSDGHTGRGVREVLTWWCMGAWFAWLVLSFGGLVAVMVGHTLINLPAAIRPFLRPNKERVTS
ncbi:hypothetical protein SAMN04489732_1128 [Amycolatopsis saalfeldensis]|uniref:Uncharacterized protein n=1 Tax=Amycolatopsis saalfeldensis TaxID=394193 RepID=A0A1H8Y888_9PSEU|nr:hypothetical protein SAMN04489732_1128 [Amycolatopsis saalfeldensis]